MTTQITPALPETFETFIKDMFVGPKKGYGQITTQDKHGGAFTRTVHFHYLETSSTFAFNTHKDSDKFLHIADSPRISGCIWDKDQNTQLCWQANAFVMDGNEEIRNRLWLKMRDEVRLAYWLDHKGIELDIDSPPDIDLEQRVPSIKVVAFVPDYWDVYLFDTRGHRFGKRFISSYENGTWNQFETSILYTSKES